VSHAEVSGISSTPCLTESKVSKEAGLSCLSWLKLQAQWRVNFYQEGHGSKMAVVVNHLVEQLYARSWHVLID